VDFQDRLEEQIAKRNIKGKLKCSINDWAINAKLLQTPYNEIHEENYEFKNLVLDRILGEEVENQLDSRLWVNFLYWWVPRGRVNLPLHVIFYVPKTIGYA